MTSAGDRGDDRIQFDEIDWCTFEDLVFEAAKKTLFSGTSARVEVERYRKGPIDIVVTVCDRALEIGTRPLPGFSKRTAYLECKHYNRPLEFADAAKVFCVALKEPPDALIIVSSQEMSPQAWEYARYFFTVDGKRGVFGGIHFDQWRLRDVLGPAAEQIAIPTEEDNPPRRWVLRASDAFTNRVVASSDSNSAVLDSRSTYTLEVASGACTHGVVVDKMRNDGVELRISGACTTLRRKPNRKTRCTIFPETLAALPERSRIALTVDCRSSGQFSIFLGQIASPGSGALIDDLRGELTTSWTARLFREDAPNIVVVSGEGGVGKTHFCLRLSAALHAERGYRCLSITATPDTSQSIFFRVLWWLILPEFGESAELPDRELIATCLSRLLLDDRRADADLVGQILASGDLRMIDIEVLTHLCARLLSQNPSPRMLVISNAQHLAPYVLRAFELLFSAIADQGWGTTRVLLEYRTGEENRRLKELISRLRDTRYASFVELVPLSERELATALDARIEPGQKGEFAHAIYRKAGGNALFVTNVILWALDEGFVTRRDGRLRVNDWPALERELSELPSEVASFLDNRIAGLLAGGEARQILPYLIVGAFGGFEIDEEQVRRITALSMSEIDTVRLYLCAKGIVSESLSGPRSTFAHEIMMLSARSAVARDVRFGAVANDIVAWIDRDAFSDAILGARVSSAMNRSRTAFDFYNRAYELARKATAFHQQCVALNGAHGVLESSQAGDELLTRRYVDITLALAEAELLGGSMVHADRALRVALDVAAREERTWPTPGEVKVWRCRALGQRIQLFVRMMKPADAMRVYGEFLGLFGDAQELPPIVRSAMTRILLTLAMASRPTDARVIAGALLNAWDTMSPDEQSSLCSDIGRIYLQADLDVAAEWWQRGVGLASVVLRK